MNVLTLETQLGILEDIVTGLPAHNLAVDALSKIRREISNNTPARKCALTLSLDPCPRCGRAHHMPLLFVAQDHPHVRDGITYPYQAQCTWTLAPVWGRLDENQRLVIEYA